MAANQVKKAVAIGTLSKFCHQIRILDLKNNRNKKILLFNILITFYCNKVNIYRQNYQKYLFNFFIYLYCYFGDFVSRTSYYL